MDQRTGPAPARYVLWFTAACAALALVRLLTHEMWRDELQAWMIARSSTSVTQLISNLRYEGHPGFWPLCLFLISRFSSSPVSMQFLNLAIGTATVFILIRFAPFPRWLSAMLALGYYVAYEYGTISRSYGLGLLFIFLFCAIFTREKGRKFRLLAVVLAALALTSVYGTIVAAALAAGAVVDAWLHRPDHRPIRRWRLLAFVAIVGLGIATAALLVRQPPDAGFRPEVRLAIDADTALMTVGSVWRGLVPVPPLTQSFWNSNVLDGLPLLRAACGAALLVVTLAALRAHTTALMIFAIGMLGLLAFTHIFYFGGIRHQGHYFLLFVACCWIAAASPPSGRISGSWRPVLAALAVVQVAAGGFASVMDMRLPFSASRATAAYIARHYPADIPIVVDPELSGVPIAAWLDRDVFFAQSQRLGGFVIWNNQRRATGLAQAVEAADRLADQQDRDLLLVMRHRTETPPPRFQHVGHFRSAIVVEESYDVYLLKHRSGPDS